MNELVGRFAGVFRCLPVDKRKADIISRPLFNLGVNEASW